MSRRSTGPATTHLAMVRGRDGWSCVICGGDDRLQTHHRRPRGMGGTRRLETNAASNLLTVCLGCHAEIESRRAESLANGWLVAQIQDPATVPVLVSQRSRWAFLSDDGSYVDGAP